MSYINVYIEHNSLALNTTFTYACDQKVEVGCRVRVPFGAQDLIGFVESVDVLPKVKNIKSVLEVLDTKPLLNEELMTLAHTISQNYVCSVISVLKTMLPPALRPSSIEHKIVYEDWAVLNDETVALTPKQKEAFASIRDQLPMKASILRKKISLSRPLFEKGVLAIEKRVKESIVPIDEIEDTSFVLTDEQQAAIEAIEKGDRQIYLLHGVTGSGKTEVFLQLAQKVLSKGKQVLFLVPEIGLTPMMIQRVKARFQTKIAIYHSSLNAQEKYEQYQLVKENKVSIVVGTRSSVFMPFSNLGLILMDEEHDSSYKQDSMPRYHTRDVVMERAKSHHCKVVLSSATPSLDSYARAYKVVYQLVTLTKRISLQIPKIHLVDMKTEQVENGLSFSLINAIQQALAKHQQVILLLNRRGYLPVVKCTQCEETFTCPDCGIALTYHKKEDLLMCHCCGRVFSFDHTCPKCHSHSFYRLGMGTEKLEENLQSMFPKAYIVRMDADSTRKKNAHAKLLKEFEEKGDILVGTQMVAKGLDYQRVSVVGILQADASLARIDYQSAETAYSMLEQASGRCGRGQIEGNVYIQTFEPDHYVMQSVIQHDYFSFFSKEMKYRHLGMYPPYVYLCTVIYQDKKEEKAMQVAQNAKAYLSDLKVLGPISISMRQQKARVRLVIKSKDKELLTQRVWQLVHHHMRLKTTVKQDINMYPFGLEE
ncbi:primosomal protein N' [Faecalicoccus pleomorphus]|uniref:replication restart helicase PriA n=1 Tax=Faecalicoccus pleomorphus TaxID=1323 RepID=UPI00232EFA1D|nr:primosomal protein N' [Faecalicoccus pleomorphus]MDB7985848.1 primosomal protein N' [Faecalicoccus pleomorphus]MDB7991141.1 primosomal protein N' [Faecalicoccus pleomorphus]